MLCTYLYNAEIYHMMLHNMLQLFKDIEEHKYKILGKI